VEWTKLAFDFEMIIFSANFSSVWCIKQDENFKTPQRNEQKFHHNKKIVPSNPSKKNFIIISPGFNLKSLSITHARSSVSSKANETLADIDP
jgi:hypothetical protein